MTAIMNEGITPYDFVQQVYYLQEKTLLDFWPTDDKYREVLVEANLVLKELEAQQDWTWLRETIVLGSCNNNRTSIVEFTIPTDVYKLSTLNHDCLRLHPYYDVEEVPVEDPDNPGQYIIKYNYSLDERRFIAVPIASAGDHRFNREYQVESHGINHVHDFKLRAVVHGNRIRFNRILNRRESAMFLVADVQKHIKPFHVCKDCLLDSNNLCPNADEKYLMEVPDINYVIAATAARHAEGSPPALARVAGLQDMAQRILSQMRQNDAEATDADWIEWDVPGYMELI